MALLGELLVSIKANATQFTSELKAAGESANNFVGDLKKNEATIKDVSKTFLVMSTAITGALALSVNEAINAQKADVALTTALKNVGIASGGALTKLDGLSDSLRVMTGYGQEELKDVMRFLIQSTGDYGIALNHTKTVANLARGANIDLNTAARLVGNAYNGNTAALTRFGIKLGDGVTGMTALLRIQQKYSGTSEAYMKTLAGQLDAFKNASGEAAENIGKVFMPQLVKLMTSVNVVTERLAKMSDSEAATVAKTLAFGAAATGIIGGLGMFAGTLVKISEGFTIAKGAATAMFTTISAHPLVAVTLALSGLSLALLNVGDKIVEADRKNYTYKASNQGLIDKFTELKRIYTAAGDSLVWYAGRQITGNEAAAKTQVTLDMLTGKLKTNTKEVQKNSDAKQTATEKSKTLTQQLQDEALALDEQKKQVEVYSGALVSGFDAMTSEIINNQRLTDKELKVGLKAILNSMLTYYSQRLAAQAAIYTSMLFDPFTAGLGASGLAGTIGQMAVIEAMKVGVAMLATGGIVDRPTLAMIGEGSSPEAVIPLPMLTPMIREAMSETYNDNKTIQVIINASDGIDSINWDALVQTKIKPAFDRNSRSKGRK